MRPRVRRLLAGGRRSVVLVAIILATGVLGPSSITFGSWSADSSDTFGLEPTIAGPAHSEGAATGRLVGLRPAQRLRSTATTLRATTPSDADAVVAQQVLDRVNAHRRAAGLRVLDLDTSLGSAAVVHAADQAARRTMTHTGADGSNAGTRISRAGLDPSWWGENVAFGYGSAAEVVAAWMDSPGHRAMLLSRNAESMGVAVRRSVDGVPYWSQTFAGSW